MRTRGVSCHARGMDNPAALRLVLDLETEDDPVCGWLERPGGERERFEGLLGLLAALEAARVCPVAIVAPPSPGTRRQTERAGSPPTAMPAGDELLERHDALRRVRDALTAAASGSGRVLMIAGEAGIGKTAVLRAAADEAQRRGLQTLAARGGVLERSLGHGWPGTCSRPSCSALPLMIVAPC